MRRLPRSGGSGFWQQPIIAISDIGDRVDAQGNLLRVCALHDWARIAIASLKTVGYEKAVTR